MSSQSSDPLHFLHCVLWLLNFCIFCIVSCLTSLSAISSIFQLCACFPCSFDFLFFTYSTLLSYSVYFLCSFHSPHFLFSVFSPLSPASLCYLRSLFSLMILSSFFVVISIFLYSLFLRSLLSWLSFFFLCLLYFLFLFLCILASLLCFSCFLRSDLYHFTVSLLCILFHTWISLSSMDADGQFHWNHRSMVKIRNRQERRKCGNQSLRKCHWGWVGVKPVSNFGCKEQAPSHQALCARGGRVSCAELLAVALGRAEHRESEWVPVPFLQEEDSDQTGEFVLTM